MLIKPNSLKTHEIKEKPIIKVEEVSPENEVKEQPIVETKINKTVEIIEHVETEKVKDEIIVQEKIKELLSVEETILSKLVDAICISFTGATTEDEIEECQKSDLLISKHAKKIHLKNQIRSLQKKLEILEKE